MSGKSFFEDRGAHTASLGTSRRGVSIDAHIILLVHRSFRVRRSRFVEQISVEIHPGGRGGGVLFYHRRVIRFAILSPLYVFLQVLVSTMPGMTQQEK